MQSSTLLTAYPIGGMFGGARSKLGSSSAYGVASTRATKKITANALNAAPLSGSSAGSPVLCSALAAHSSGVESS